MAAATAEPMTADRLDLLERAAGTGVYIGNTQNAVVSSVYVDECEAVLELAAEVRRLRAQAGGA